MASPGHSCASLAPTRRAGRCSPTLKPAMVSTSSWCCPTGSPGQRPSPASRSSAVSRSGSSLTPSLMPCGSSGVSGSARHGARPLLSPGCRLPPSSERRCVASSRAIAANSLSGEVWRLPDLDHLAHAHRGPRSGGAPPCPAARPITGRAWSRGPSTSRLIRPLTSPPRNTSDRPSSVKRKQVTLAAPPHAPSAPPRKRSQQGVTSCW